MSELRKLQLVELNILDEFDRVCRKNNIKYSLGYGTLLGAIRHKGFIPWDDDVDIMMEYSEYLKFENIAQKELNDKFYFQSRNINPKNFVFWNRIGLKETTSIDLKFERLDADWGICIDIFPMFPLSDDLKLRKKQYRWLKYYRLLSLKYYHIHTFKEATLKEKIKKIPHFLIPRKLNMILSKYYFNKFKGINLKNTNNCIEYAEFPRIKTIDSDIFSKYIQIDFENKKYQAVSDWDKLLTTIYGDYMTPPDDNNKTKHSDDPNVVIDFCKSYTNYLKK